MPRKKQKLDGTEGQRSGDNAKSTTPTRTRTSRVSMSAALDLLFLQLSEFQLVVCVFVCVYLSLINMECGRTAKV